MPIGTPSGRLPRVESAGHARPDARSTPVKTPSIGGMAAAVDLGSNSFHMVIGRIEEHDVRIVDRIKEPVQLAAGLEDRRIAEEAQARALACLEKFGQRLRDMPHRHVRAVGTNTLRVAKNARAFLTRAQKALGHPIEVVSGREEARLIYLGVSHSLPDDTERRLVVDVGGGSTELILGERFDVVQAESLHMGCVSWSATYFPEGKLTRGHFKKADTAARRELQTLERRFRQLGWESAYGSSGTNEALMEILKLGGYSEQGITKDGLRKLRKVLVEAGHMSKVTLPGLKPERAPVLPGGLAIVLAAFESLGIERLLPAGGALREGVLYDLLGRIRHEDVRDRTIRGFTDRYVVDREQAARVERTAIKCLKQVAAAWELEDPELKHVMEWAARLHEVGLAISYTSYHKHGGYLLTHSDMPGFSNDDKLILATLVRTHRRKLSAPLFPEGLPLSTERLVRLSALLRVAVLLNRSRSPRALPPFKLQADKSALTLTFPDEWLEEHPLTRADLEEEASALEAVGLELELA